MAAIETIINAMLTGVNGGRCYPQFRPQNGTLPAVVWHTISTVPDSRISMSSGAGLWRSRVQVDCVDQTYSGCKALADTITAAMHLKSGSYGGKVVVSSLIDQIGADAVDQEAALYMQPIDFLITFYD